MLPSAKSASLLRRFSSRAWRSSECHAPEKKNLILRHVGHVIHELWRSGIERISEWRFGMRRIAVAQRAVVAIETSTGNQAHFVRCDGIRQFGGSTGNARVHGMPGERTFHLRRRIVRTHVDETHQCEYESEYKNENHRHNTSDESFHRA